MVDSFIKKHFELVKKYDKDHNIKSKTGLPTFQKSVITFISLYVMYLIILFNFELYSLASFFLALILVSGVHSVYSLISFRKETIKFKESRKKYFVKFYNDTLKINKDVEDGAIFQIDEIGDGDLINVNDKKVKELASIVKDFANRMKVKYTINFSLVPLSLTFLIAWLNFSNNQTEDKTFYLVLVSAGIIIFYTVLSTLLTIFEEQQNKNTKNLEDLTDILNELHIQKLINAESNDVKELVNT
ncbi:hypothetical protein [Exiguobacterium sp. s37]|uniref:hypothetical protein n=1 Tax=Exiguobacterium sp. s37 TaxID=2751275 RepID=UPI001BE7DCF5|nr:hypothetical protein [Exiguobacterium sp. s37]